MRQGWMYRHSGGYIRGTYEQQCNLNEIHLYLQKRVYRFDACKLGAKPDRCRLPPWSDIRIRVRHRGTGQIFGTLSRLRVNEVNALVWRYSCVPKGPG